MDWSAQPGDGDSHFRPSKHVMEVYDSVLASSKLKLKNYEKDLNEVWRALDFEVERGTLTADEFVDLRRDHNGDFSIPLAKRYFAAGKTEAVTKWMRDQAAFWNYNWVDRSVYGGFGRGTLKLLEIIRTEGEPMEGARLAADHFAKRFTGARYHSGLRGELKTWYSLAPDVRRTRLREHHAKYGSPHHIEQVFIWMKYIPGRVSAFVADGDEETKQKHAATLAQLEKELAKFAADLEGL